MFILPVSENIVEPNLPLTDYAARFYEYFSDGFDFLMFVTSLGQGESERRAGASYFPVQNDVRGIGKSVDTRTELWSSTGRLQGVIFFSTYATYDHTIHGVRWSILTDGSPLHELMHRWANGIVPSLGSHWGFSSADGYLGGFAIEELMDHGDGRYTAGNFVPNVGRAWTIGPYSQIELYLAGFIPPEGVPDLWVAEDGEWLLDQDGNHVLAENGYPIFTGSQVRTYSIDDIIAEHGARVPDVSQAQKDFRAAVILLVDENHPVTPERLQRLSEDVSWLSHPGKDNADQFNFFEATGGRGTITTDGLSRFLMDTTTTPQPTTTP